MKPFWLLGVQMQYMSGQRDRKCDCLTLQDILFLQGLISKVSFFTKQCKQRKWFGNRILCLNTFKNHIIHSHVSNRLHYSNHKGAMPDPIKGNTANYLSVVFVISRIRENIKCFSDTGQYF